MSESLGRIARALVRHRRRATVVLILSLVLLVGLAKFAGPAPPDNFDIPGTDTQRAIDLLNRYEPKLSGQTAAVVFRSSGGLLIAKEKAGEIEAAVKRLEALPGVDSVSNPLDPEAPSISPNKRIALATVLYKSSVKDFNERTIEELKQAGDISNPGVEVAYGGPVIDSAASADPPTGELIGIALAIILLSFLFRSGWAMFVTLSGALIGVAVGQLILHLLDAPLGLPSFAATIAIMLGLGAGIDYSLLIVSRYREQRANGDSLADAAAKAAATSGAAVVAAGMIVMVAIAGLLVIGIPLIGKMGVAAAIGVGAVVLSALTLLPILFAALGPRLKPRYHEVVEPSDKFRRWGEIVTRRPWLSIFAGVLILLVFAIPALHMQLGQPDDSTAPAGSTQRLAYDWTSEGFGAGVNGPFLIAIKTPNAGAKTKASLKKLEEKLAATVDVATVTPAEFSPGNELATITLIPKTSPQDKRTSKLLEQIRQETIPESLAGSGLYAYVGGATAAFEDFSDKVSGKLLLFIFVVIGMSILLLTAAFRSIWIPLASAGFNLLSISAAYGVIVLVFQDGFGASLIGVEAGVPIISFIPVIVFAILFGLSMDYNVFLLSRVHEAYNEGLEPRESVIEGVSRIGKLILFAGLIMSSVFLAFVSQSDVTAKMVGLGLGAAILIDVLLIRLVIAPAVVTLLGDRAWQMPAWLDRILPNISLEGHLVSSEDPVEPAAPAKHKPTLEQLEQASKAKPEPGGKRGEKEG